MATPEDVLAVALNEVGYSRWDDPLPGTKYGRWYAEYTGQPWFGTSGVPYCAMFISWVLNQCGVESPVTPSAVAFDEGNNFNGRRVDKYYLQRGDLVAFDWDSDWSGDHVGIVSERRDDGGYDITVEGNTGDGQVLICTRYPSQIICGCRPYYDEATVSAYDEGKLAVDGAGGPNTIAVLQRFLGCLDDGVISGQEIESKVYHANIWSVEYDSGSGSQMVMALQKMLGIEEDGLWGPQTSKAFQTYLADKGYYTSEIDGYFGPQSVRALQNFLNDNI